MVYAEGRTREPVVNRPTSAAERQRFCLTDEQVLRLADFAIRIEDHYSRRAGRPTPMDIEWALDGLDHEIYIIQARPETVTSQRAAGAVEEYVLEGKGDVLARGRAVGTRVAAGRARLVKDPRQLHAFRDGEVLVADTTTPDWEPVMKRAAAIVTNRGGRTCHAAIVARELGIPAVVGAENATDGGRGWGGDHRVLRRGRHGPGLRRPGAVRGRGARISARSSGPRPDVMINLGNPELAFGLAFLPADGVGLARLEFIINEYIKVASDGAAPSGAGRPTRRRGARSRPCSRAGRRAREYFVTRLAEGVGTIAAAFWPRDVIVRLSDFKTNEYAALLGGQAFEPREENPMLGFRGASRYAHPAYREAFALECAAMRRVRETNGAQEPEGHGPVLPPPGRGRPSARGHGRGGARARSATGSRSTSCARSRPTSS